MSTSAAIDDDRVDDSVDEEIYGYLSLASPVSFFLFAGAGSGKTRSLEKVVRRFRDEHGRQLWLKGQRFAVITYTNAACDEIKRRVDYHPLIEVSTIHSFAWSLIGGFHGDIRDWIRKNLTLEIAELEQAQRKGRAGTKAALEREKSIESKRHRLAHIDGIKRFTYSPTGDNRGRDALSHSEVIALTASFLTEKPVLQSIFVNKYPYLLIDESQDTNRYLMDAFLLVQSRHPTRFCLGLFGDTMQRIYADGKVDLPAGLPGSWRRPEKKMNHRCPARIVRMINKIRSTVDGLEQKSRQENGEGQIRLFVIPSNTVDKFKAEAAVARRMAEVTGDADWDPTKRNFKTLTLEHHMAARRMGFLKLFEPLYAIDRLRTGLLDGSLPGLSFFIQDVVPLWKARLRCDEYAVAAIVRKRSPLLDKAFLRAAGSDQPAMLKKARDAVNALMALWDNGTVPLLIDVLRCVHANELFRVPDILLPLAASESAVTASEEKSGDAAVSTEERRDEVIEAWEHALVAPFQELVAYVEYISGDATFDTHQGVKGLEFPRVMVIIDDEESRGFLFSYDKLLGAKGKSETDLANERVGKETSVDRTRRLFYVTCSRAKKSLAVVHYSSDSANVRNRAISEGWFDAEEIEVVA